MDEDPDQKPEYDHPTRDVIIILAVFFEFGLAPFSLLLGWLLSRPPLATFEWSWNAVGWGILATIPLGLMFLGMLRWPIGPLARVKHFCENEVVPLLDGAHGRTSHWCRCPPAWERRCSSGVCSRPPSSAGCKLRSVTRGERPAASGSRALFLESSIPSRCRMP